MKIFYFTKLTWKYIIFLLFFVFSFLQNFIIRWISMNSKDIAQPFLNTYLFVVSDYLAIIPYLIVIIRSKHIKSENIELKKVDKRLIHNQGTKKSKNFIWLILSLTLFDFLSHISSLMFYIIYGKNDRSVSENNLSSLLIFNTFTIYLFTKWILKTDFYKHHYFSILINIFCVLILGTLDIINIISSDNDSETDMIIFYIFKKISSIIFYSIEDVIGKKILMEEFISIYELLLYRGFFETLLDILFTMPFFFIEVTDKSTGVDETGIIFRRIKNLFDKLNTFKIVLFVTTNLFYNIFIWLIIDQFSPIHYAISNILDSCGTLIRLWITEPENIDLPILRIFIYLILIFGSLIHTEIIVINYWDLQKNTKIFLEEKESEDFSLINYRISDNNENLNTSIDSLDQSF